MLFNRSCSVWEYSRLKRVAFLYYLEAVTQRSSVKKVFLENARNFQKFEKFSVISKNTFSYRTPPVAVSDYFSEKLTVENQLETLLKRMKYRLIKHWPCHEFFYVAELFSSKLWQFQQVNLSSYLLNWMLKNIRLSKEAGLHCFLFYV